MFRNGPFAVCQALKEASGRPGTYGLNRAPSESDFLSQVVKFSARKEKSAVVRGVRGNKHSLDARVHSYNASCLFRFWNFFLITKNQIQFIIDFFKFRVLPAVHGNVPLVQGKGFTPKGNTFSGFIEVPFPYNRNRRVFKSSQDPFLVGFGNLICCSYLLAYTASKLGRKLKLTAKGWIIGLGESVRVQLFGIEDYRTDPVQGLDVVFDYILGLERAGYFDFGSPDNFHYKVSFIPM